MHETQLREVKANLSAVVDEAMNGQPTVITRHGRKAAVVISWEEWQRLSSVPSLARLLMAAPMKPEDIEERDQSPLREVDL
jgi:prevent-host-death family protein